MSMFVTTGATLQCTFGTAPGSLKATTSPTIKSDGQVVANIQDFAGGVNISSFGMCTTLSNPQVAAATAAALGVLTPQPCIPQTTPWIPSAMTTMIGGKCVLTQDCTCMCAYGGTVAVVAPGQTKALTK